MFDSANIRLERRNSRWLTILAICLLLINLGVTLGDKIFERQHAEARKPIPRGKLSAEESNNIDIFGSASPSVVHITTMRTSTNALTLNARQIPAGTGTGIIWDNNGHVVTNYHVIQNSDSAIVTLSDHSTYEAERVGVAPDKDLAVLKLKKFKHKIEGLPLGTSNDLLVGQKVFAIGNPFGLDQTLTTGIISALGREIESVTRRPITDVIQIDAAINPGNSGGPLLDSSGRLIGVNTAIYSPTGSSNGIGFAIPVDIVRRVVPDLIRFGRVERPSLGIRVLRDDLARRLGVSGLLVLGLVPDGGAAKAGIKPTYRNSEGRFVLGDQIVAVNNFAIKSLKDLYKVLDQRKIGDSVKVDVLRGKSEMTFDVELTDLP